MIVAYVGRKCRVSTYANEFPARGRKCEIVSIGPSGSLAKDWAKIRVFDCSAANGEYWECPIKISELESLK